MKLEKLLSRKAEIEKAIQREEAREKRRDEVLAILDKLDLVDLTDTEILAAFKQVRADKQAKTPATEGARDAPAKP